MDMISTVLTIVICAVIVIGFFAVMRKLKTIRSKLQDLKKEIERNSYSTETELLESGVDPINKIQQTKQSMVTTLDYDAVNRDRDRYNRLAGEYLSYIQMISIFPLVGLLGTVIGILFGMKGINSGDTSGLYASLGTALWTTFAGLIAAIILKWYDAMNITAVIQEIEYQFESKDREYQNMIAREKYIEAEH